MKKLKILAFILVPVLLFGVFVSCSFINIKTSYATTSAKAMCVLDAESGRVLYSKNENEKLAMASTTKIITAITVLQHCKDLNQLVSVDDCAVGVGGTSIYLRKDEVLSVKDLLYGLMLRSGNDAATALACYVGGSVEGFAEKMNNLAIQVGAKNSHFVNPHGLDVQGHYTTAYDLALITSYALNNPVFKEIVSTKTYQIEATNKSEKRYLTNKNRLLANLEGCCGVKTGFTNKAGRCLVSACERNGRKVVCVVLNCGPMFEESEQLLNSAYKEFEMVKIIDKNKEIYNEYILDENKGKLYLYSNEDFSYPLTNEELKNIKIDYSVKLKQAKEGDEVGKIDVYLNNRLLKTLKLYTMNKIDKLIESKTLTISELLWEEKLNENKQIFSTSGAW